VLAALWAAARGDSASASADEVTTAQGVREVLARSGRQVLATLYPLAPMPS
jgi:hypothetical protein